MRLRAPTPTTPRPSGCRARPGPHRPPSEDWAAALDGLRRGERNATDRIAGLVTRSVRGIAATVVAEGCEDVVQDVLIALLRQPPRTRISAAAARHIRTTAQRKAIDAVRRARGRRRVRAGESETSGWRTHVALAEAGDPSAHARHGDAAGAVWVQQVLDRLDAPHRRALELRVFEGCSIDETATQLGISTATVKRRVARALSEARSGLNERAA